MWQIEILWCGKWRKLFRGEYARLEEYRKQCPEELELRIIWVEK